MQEKNNLQPACKILLGFLRPISSTFLITETKAFMSDNFSFQNSYIFLKRGGGKQALGVLTLLEYCKMSNDLTVSLEEMGYVVKSRQTSFPLIWSFTVIIVKIKVWFCFYVQESNLFLLREGNLKLPAL